MILSIQMIILVMQDLISQTIQLELHLTHQQLPLPKMVLQLNWILHGNNHELNTIKKVRENAPFFMELVVNLRLNFVFIFVSSRILFWSRR